MISLILKGIFLLQAWMNVVHASPKVVYPFESFVTTECGATISVLSQLRGEIEILKQGRCDSVQVIENLLITAPGVTTDVPTWKIEVGSVIRFGLSDLFHIPEVRFFQSQATDLGASVLVYESGKSFYQLPDCNTEMNYRFHTGLRLFVMGSSYCSEMQIGNQKVKLHKGKHGYLVLTDLDQAGSIPVTLYSESRAYQDRFTLTNDVSCETAVRRDLGHLLKKENLLQGEVDQITAQFRKVSVEGNLVYWVKAQTPSGSYFEVSAQPRSCEIASIRLLTKAF